MILRLCVAIFLMVVFLSLAALLEWEATQMSKQVFPSDMPWYIRWIQGTIDFVLGLFGRNPDA